MKIIWTAVDQTLQKQTPEDSVPPKEGRDPTLRRVLLAIAFIFVLAFAGDFLDAPFWDIWAQAI